MFAENMQTRNFSKLRSLPSSGPNRSCSALEQMTVLIRCQSNQSTVVSSFCSFIPAPLHPVVLSVPAFQTYHIFPSSWVDLLSTYFVDRTSASFPRFVFNCYRHVLFLLAMPKPNHVTHTHQLSNANKLPL